MGSDRKPKAGEKVAEVKVNPVSGDLEEFVGNRMVETSAPQEILEGIGRGDYVKKERSVGRAQKKVDVEEEKKGPKQELVTDDDRAIVMQLARRYLRDHKHPAIQRWAWEKVLPYSLPKLASSELKTKEGDGFKIIVDDYRSPKKQDDLGMVVGGFGESFTTSTFDVEDNEKN